MKMIPGIKILINNAGTKIELQDVTIMCIGKDSTLPRKEKLFRKDILQTENLGAIIKATNHHGRYISHRFWRKK